MKINLYYFKSIVCLLFFLFFFNGCASWLGARFYSGNPLSRQDVAFLYLTGNCQMGGITKEGQKKMEFLMWSETKGEILPGNYVLELRYFSKGTYSSSKGDIINLSLNAKAGHVYYIRPAFPTPDKWRPVVIDIANDQDYVKILDGDPKIVQKKVEQYFQGERKPLEESEFKTRGGGVTKRWH